ncbi:hypothetical protein N7G274_010468 [Stereocaulon virgatum]|uniref:Uncharacterized protein n=1 Tax=Stereocaulon virgatum TaxID=373712 RepID=A0ABR3ZVR4_9LECA
MLLAAACVAVQACERCPHPGNFTGKLGLLRNATDSYCGTVDTPAHSIYASINTTFYSIRDESPCDAPINVTNPSINKTIQAIVVGECSTCIGGDIQLTTLGYRALSPNGKGNKPHANVTWTFA